jgi:hypothetical protein
MQFRGDWPGLFIRGDDAIFIAASIRQLETHLSDSHDVRIAHAVARLSEIAEIIERDVRVRPDESG